jgi:hypothetical protein
MWKVEKNCGVWTEIWKCESGKKEKLTSRVWNQISHTNLFFLLHSSHSFIAFVHSLYWLHSSHSFIAFVHLFTILRLQNWRGYRIEKEVAYLEDQNTIVRHVFQVSLHLHFFFSVSISISHSLNLYSHLCCWWTDMKNDKFDMCRH